MASSRSRSPSLPSDGASSNSSGCQKERLLKSSTDGTGEYTRVSQRVNDWNRAAGFVSVGGVRYGVRLAAAKYSAVPRRALAECCGQSRAACCGRQHSVTSKPALPACFRPKTESEPEPTSTTQPPSPPHYTLDRLQRFRFGGRSASGERKQRPDKAERLRELTERLRGRPPPPLPPPRLHRHTKSTEVPEETQHRMAPRAHSECDEVTKDEDRFDSIDIKPMRAESRAIVGSYAQRTIPFRSASFSQVDYNALDGKYSRTIPKMTSKQSDTDSLSSTNSGSTVCPADLTLPRKKDSSSRLPVPVPETANSGSIPSIDSAVGSDEGLCTEVPMSRIPTVVNDSSYNHSGSRSLTHPLPGRSVSVDSDVTLNDMNSDGRKSLQYFPDSQILRDIHEESDVSVTDSARDPSDTVSSNEGPPKSCPFHVIGIVSSETSTYVQNGDKCENPQSLDVNNPTQSESPPLISVTTECTQAQIFIETPEGKVLKTATASEIPVPVYECIVREWSNIPVESWENDNRKSDNNSLSSMKMIDQECGDETCKEICHKQNIMETTDDETITSEQVENLLATVQMPSKLPPPASEEKKRVLDKSKRRKGIYITKWPIHDEISGLILPESVIKGDFNQNSLDRVPNGEIINLETGDSELFIGDVNRNGSRTHTDINAPSTAHETLSNDSNKWTGHDTAFIWNTRQDETVSPETDDQFNTPQWPKSLTEPRWNSRPALTYQSSEEKEELGVPKIVNKRCTQLARADSLSEGESESGGLSTPIRDRTASPSPFNPSDVSDNECRSHHGKERSSHPRRYSKRPLRGPYGQMLEAEMKKPESKLSKHDEELKFLDELVASPTGRPLSPSVGSSRTSLASNTSSLGIPEPRRGRGGGNHSLDDTQLKTSFSLSSSPTQKTVIRLSPKRKVSANIPYSAPNPVTSPSEGANRTMVFHQRTTSSPSKLEGFSPRNSASADCDKKKLEPSVELLAELLRGSSERLLAETSLDGIPFCVQRHSDTRTHVVVELYDTERSYVEALQILVSKYLQPLKSSENVGLVDAALVDEIFYQVPAILALHEVFLEELRKRLENWDVKQKVGDIFLNVFSKSSVSETYTSFINNWKKAKETIKSTSSARPAFARFLEAMAREHKGKLSLDNLLIKPVQKFPRYELLIQRLIKHTEPSHPDHQLLIEAQKAVHELLVKINCTERESLELEQQQQTLRELESLVEGLGNLVCAERSFLRHDTVTMAGGTKERALFLFSDLLLITSIKRRTGTIRKPATVGQGSLTSTLDAYKYKLLMRISLDDLEVVKAKDENVRRIMKEMESLSEDMATLRQIAELTAALHCTGKAQLEELARDLMTGLARQLSERQGSDSQLGCLELSLNAPTGIESLQFVFSKPEKRTSWEEMFNEAKQKMALSDDKRPAPEFVAPVPIRKTRAGLQFTCAAPTFALGANSTRDVWVCNSDGYVGQVCVLTLHPEPQVTSCNGVCNARILCVACIPPAAEAVYKTSALLPSSEQTITALNRQNFSISKTTVSISIQDSEDKTQNIRLESSSSSEDDDDGSSTGEMTNDNNTIMSGGNNGDVQVSNQLNSSITSNTMKPSSSQAKSGSGGGGSNSQNIPVNPVMKSSSNPSVDKSLLSSATASPKQSMEEGNNANQPTMWLGTEDGCIHVYNCSDNIRIKKNKVKIQHGSGIFFIVYVDNKVFVSLANGDIIVYGRENGGWAEHTTISVGTVSCPVTKLLLSGGKLWCSQHTNVKIINPITVQVEDSFSVSSDFTKPISHMAISGLAVWVALHNTATLKCYHANTKDLLTELNIAPAVTKMLAGCDDIIRQHKAACLRVTSLLACRDLLWVGTSAGVLLTASAAPPRPPSLPTLSGIPQGHTGHVRFLTVVESSSSSSTNNLNVSNNKQNKSLLRRSTHSPNQLKGSSEAISKKHLLVISGGDGYEDFRSSGVSEVAGREDSTNHLLLWKV